MKNLKISKKKGFSLVELLVVIAVIGVIAAIAIPAMSGIFGRADSAKVARNAQSIVSTFNAARAAGNTTAYANASAAVDAITAAAGINGQGQFASSTFAAPMTATEKALALPLITSVGASDADRTLTIIQP